MTATLAAPAPATKPLSRWLADEAGRYLSRGDDRGCLVARVLCELAADARLVETAGRELTVEAFLDRIEALRGDD